MIFSIIHIQDTYTFPSMGFILIIMTFVMISVFSISSLCVDNNDEVSEYVIGVGDVIQIYVWGYDEYNTTATVGPDGKITIPGLGDIYVAKLNREKVKKNIMEKLSEYIKEGAEVTVSVAQFNSQKIHIFGQVRNPKTITFLSPPSLLEVMVQLELTPEADLTAVKIIPANPEIRKPVTVDIAKVLKTGDASQLPELHSGDTIYIPRMDIEKPEETEPKVEETQTQPAPEAIRTQVQQPPVKEKESFIINVIGSVRSPSTIKFDEEPTLTEVLLKVGSVTDSVGLKDIRIVRGDPTLGDKVINVNFEEYLTTGDASLLPKLFSGDIIYIPDITQDKTKEASITITGQVLRPGAYRISGTLNILDAILLAGGLNDSADTEMIKIRREPPDAYEEKIVNIDEFLNNVESSDTLEMVGPGYTVYVPLKRRPVVSIAMATRGVAAFLADLIAVYSLYRWIR